MTACKSKACTSIQSMHREMCTKCLLLEFRVINRMQSIFTVCMNGHGCIDRLRCMISVVRRAISQPSSCEKTVQFFRVFILSGSISMANIDTEGMRQDAVNKQITKNNSSHRRCGFATQFKRSTEIREIEPETHSLTNTFKPYYMECIYHTLYLKPKPTNWNRKRWTFCLSKSTPRSKSQTTKHTHTVTALSVISEEPCILNALTRSKKVTRTSYTHCPTEIACYFSTARYLFCLSLILLSYVWIYMA